MKFRTLFMMALTIFCGAGAGVFLTFSDESLFGTYLYTFFPFAVALLFLAIGYDILHEWQRKETTSKLREPVKKSRVEEQYTAHHAKPV